jgi:hypothetical protein
MKGKYKGCDIEVTRDKCLGGWDMLFYSIFDDGFEVTSGFSDSSDKIKDFYNDLKEVVDDYRLNPKHYEPDWEYL